MASLPLIIAVGILIAACGIALSAYLLRDHIPERMRQAMLGAAFSVRSAVKTLYAVIRWPITLVVAYLVILTCFILHLPVALAWVTLKKVAGEPAKVTFKLD